MLQLAGGFHLTHRFSRPLRRGYARAVINIGALSRSAERARHCSFAAGSIASFSYCFPNDKRVVAVGQDKSAQPLAKALRVLDTEKCDEKVARVALDFAAMESAKDVTLAIKEAEMRSEGEIAVVRYKYAAVSSRFWLEKLFTDIIAFAVQEKWPRIKSMRDTKHRLSMKGINRYLRRHPEKWKDFVAAHNLQTKISKEKINPKIV